MRMFQRVSFMLRGFGLRYRGAMCLCLCVFPIPLLGCYLIVLKLFH